MKPKFISGIGALFVALLLVVAVIVPAVSADRTSPEDAIDDTDLSERLQYVMSPEKAPEPQSQAIDASDHIRTVDLSNQGIDISNLGEIGPLAIEFKVGDLYFNESWGSTPAIASLKDYTLTGVPEEGLWVKPWVEWKFDDTDCGQVAMCTLSLRMTAEPLLKFVRMVLERAIPTKVRSVPALFAYTRVMSMTSTEASIEEMSPIRVQADCMLGEEDGCIICQSSLHF